MNPSTEHTRRACEASLYASWARRNDELDRRVRRREALEGWALALGLVVAVILGAMIEHA